MKTMLVPLDGSTLAEQVLPYVQLLAQTLRARVYLLHILSHADKERLLANDATLLEQTDNPLRTQREREAYLWDMLRARVGHYLATEAAKLCAAGLDVDIDVLAGPPAELIVDIAEIEQVTLIAMATHGYSGFRRWAIGSVTDKVVRGATAPVFVVRCAPAQPATPPALQRILVPLDGSPFSQHAVPFAVRLAQEAQAEILLLRAIVPTRELYPGLSLLGPHMREQAGVAPAEREQALQLLHRAAEQAQINAVPYSPMVKIGYPAEVIVDEATQEHVDLIVMATHGYTGLRRYALGSIADKVLHATTTPLLLVPAPHYPEGMREPADADNAAPHMPRSST